MTLFPDNGGREGLKHFGVLFLNDIAGEPKNIYHIYIYYKILKFYITYLLFLFQPQNSLLYSLSLILNILPV